MARGRVIVTLMPSMGNSTVSPMRKGLDHSEGRVTFTAPSGIRQPLVRLRWIRFGVVTLAPLRAYGWSGRA